jgi:hypothetical protein
MPVGVASPFVHRTDRDLTARFLKSTAADDMGIFTFYPRAWPLPLSAPDRFFVIALQDAKSNWFR